jgi:hypothetical protein
MTSSDEATAGIEMFLVRPAEGQADSALESIAEHTALLGGVVFMSTGGGSLVVGLPTGRKEALQAHSCVGFVGGVSFAEDAPGLKVLRQRFALNAARQLAERGSTSLTDPGAGTPFGRRASASWSQRLADPHSFISSAGRDVSLQPEGKPP